MITKYLYETLDYYLDFNHPVWQSKEFENLILATKFVCFTLGIFILFGMAIFGPIIYLELYK